MEPVQVSNAELKRMRADTAINRKRKGRILFGVAVIVIGGLFVWGGITYSRKQVENTPGVAYENQGQEHVALDYAFEYNSNPPSSGPHYARPANWGMYDYEVNDKIFIHNLEHGGIWISYRPGVGDPALGDLKTIVEEFGGSKIVLAPRSANDVDVAVVAWGWLSTFDLVGDRLNEEQRENVRSFYRAHKNRGPEMVPDFMPGINPETIQ